MSTGIPLDFIAENYDRARPSYPKRLFSDLFHYIGNTHRESNRLATIEIGPGTGQATSALLKRGATVAAIEPAPDLATFLRAKFPEEPYLVVINERFEDAPLPEGITDLVIAAASFDCLNRDTRYDKTLALLRPGGVLAIVQEHHVTSETDRGYFNASKPIYAQYFDGEDSNALLDENITPAEVNEIISTHAFENVELFRYKFDLEYSTTLYADLVRSYSKTQQMPSEMRESFIAALVSLIDNQFEGYVVQPTVLTLLLARKQQVDAAHSP